MITADGTGDYPTIQAAINASVDGDTIILANGRFQGSGNRDLVFPSRSLLIRSEVESATFCTIDCASADSSPHRGFTFSQESRVVVESITIENGAAEGGGSGALCAPGSKPVLKNVLFQLNLTTALTGDGASPSLIGCTFRSNSDGALFFHGGAPALIGCTFEDNFASYSGGAVAISGASVLMIDCAFERNSAGFSGGAIDAVNVVGGTQPGVNVTNCRFSHNSAGYNGGAVSVTGVAFSLSKCSFVSNVSGVSGGAMSCRYAAIGTVDSTLFIDNSSGQGAAAQFGASVIDMKGIIVAFNHGSEAVFCDSLDVSNSVSVLCSDVFGNDGGDWTGCLSGRLGENGNISQDPLFCDPAIGDYRLRPDSPCGSASVCGLMGPFVIGCQ